ncbi:hypothetical protein ABZ517_05640 [Streptomyces scabiei]|uniref:hypothetical protein n=1 Tax=Streptomyces scabiei TaxID=1930 RepID=UPI003404D208
MSELNDLWQKAMDSVEGDDAFARLRRVSLLAAASKFGIEPTAASSCRPPQRGRMERPEGI